MTTTRRPAKGRYEFRVWGDRKDVYQRLSDLADSDRRERLEDLYLIVDDESCNAKIRENRLKIKRLVGQRAGFDRWSSSWCPDMRNAPEPLEELAELLSPPGAPGRSDVAFLDDALRELGPDHGIVPVFVTKRRRRFRFGTIKAEASTVEIDGRPGRFKTLAIEGPNLADLVTLRTSLGLNDVPNLALHLAVDPSYRGRRPRLR